MVSGDALTDIDLSAAAQFHRQKGAAVTLVLSRVANPLSYGVVLIDAEGGRITQFLEKPSWSEVFSDTVNTGIYILEPEIFDLVALGEKVDFSRDLFPELLRKGFPMYGWVADGYWSDIGNLDVYRKAHRDCLDGKVRLDLPTAHRGESLFRRRGWKSIPKQRWKARPISAAALASGGQGASIGPPIVFWALQSNFAPGRPERCVLWSGVQIGPPVPSCGAACVRVMPGCSLMCRSMRGAVLGAKVQVGSLTTIAANTKIWPEKNNSQRQQTAAVYHLGVQERASLFNKMGLAGDFRGGSYTGGHYSGWPELRRFFLGKGGRVLTTHAPSELASLAVDALSIGLRGGGLQVLDGGGGYR